MTPAKVIPFRPCAKPTIPRGAQPACPILLEAERLLEVAHDLHKALRSFRRSTRRCLACPRSGACPAMRHITGNLDAAIRELTRHWKLDRF